MEQDNPFLALFESPASAKVSSKQPLPASLVSLKPLIHEFLGFTWDPSQVGLILIESSNQSHDDDITLPTLENALFERLLLSDPISQQIPAVDPKKAWNGPGYFKESRCMSYLGGCLRPIIQGLRSSRPSADQSLMKSLRDLVVRNMITAFLEPDIYQGQDLYGQVFELLSDHAYQSENGVFLELLISADWLILGYFATSALPAELFIQCDTPANLNAGSAYGDTALGVLLTMSCLPKFEIQPYDFFESPSNQTPAVHSATEARIWTGLQNHRDKLTVLFKQFLKASDKAKHLLLEWIGNCLKANVGRGKLWTSAVGGLLGNDYVSDGFALNLGGVLLRLCEPFVSGVKNPRILKIRPNYTATQVQNDPSVHMKGLHEETTLVPNSEESLNPMIDQEASMNFISDIFFLTQKCLNVGFRVAQEKFMKLNQELNRHQTLYREVIGSNREAVETIQKRMNVIMTRYLSIKAALLEPNTLKAHMDLTTATSAFLVQVAMSEGQLINSEKFIPLSFPLPKHIPLGLKFIPEFVMENICEHMLYVKRFNPYHFEEAGYENLYSTLELILAFTGSPTWTKNPHLRARLAECLDCLLPHHALQEKNLGNSMACGSFHRQQVFMAHPLRLQIVPTLLHVFVSIETTGQAVQFEEKFSYRRPMYDVIKYLWDMEEYRDMFVSLAKSAEEHIDDEEAPLFLRFMNLLINDAIFLLDEGLDLMKQIQEMQSKRAEWQSLPANERGQSEAQYRHVGRMARYQNIMGMETIEMLERLSSHIKAIFTHPSMVDRLGGMLNYFLKNLVGPDRKKFKVDKVEEYDFRPADIVTTICKTYINLKDCEVFLAAVSADGRSYSPDLFKQAEGVLLKIGKMDMIADLQEIDTSVCNLAASQKADDELFADAPDHFLDPIMSILMNDPVKLPDSGQIVDRQTIARHLLSDQSDPFNRMPLTLDKVIPQTELKQEIQNWVATKRKTTTSS
ncbi:hypothetical protein TCAL_12264 [Tigriopus californicus]|uniref:Ubiquitin conjugation factor E4 A n=1 Tax=Tigriopus californicus TaxID=6832 RepID=A0A553N8K4_TIGCA|nr:hypothetical protein TCAL_12264 [Tigriopus californicus]